MPDVRGSLKDIGSLDKKIKFQRYAGVSDGTAGKRPTWSDLQPTATRWAKMENAPGNRLVPVANRMIWMNAVVFKIQYDPIIHTIPTGKLRVVYPASGSQQRAYKIIGMSQVANEDYFLEIICDGNEIEAA